MAQVTCTPSQRGPNDYYLTVDAFDGGLHCCYSKIVLRARGVDATTPDEP